MIESLTRIEATARRMDGYADEWVPRYLAEELARERDNALSDAHQSEVDSLRALHERNEARIAFAQATDLLVVEQSEHRGTREQRDRMVAAIEKHKTSLPFRPDYEDYQLWDSLPEKEDESRTPNPEP